MRKPSIARLLEAFPQLTHESAKDIRKAMETMRPSQALDIADEYLGTCGVEYIGRGHNSKSPAMLYCNTGDSYGTTIIYSNGAYRIGAWGDTVERGHYD